MLEHLREIDKNLYAFMSAITWASLLGVLLGLAIAIPSTLFTKAKELEDNNVLKFMAENGYSQKWEPNSQQLIWTKEVK